MKQEIWGDHRVDEQGNPAGGRTSALGIRIRWQNGPLGRDRIRKDPNGAFVEGVIEAAKDRLNFYQYASEGRFADPHNAKAIEYLEKAAAELQARTRERERRGVEGTHAP